MAQLVQKGRPSKSTAFPPYEGGGGDAFLQEMKRPLQTAEPKSPTNKDEKADGSCTDVEGSREPPLQRPWALSPGTPSWPRQIPLLQGSQPFVTSKSAFNCLTAQVLSQKDGGITQAGKAEPHYTFYLGFEKR